MEKTYDKHLDKICEMEEKLIEYAEHYLSLPQEQVDTHELGEVVDMIKDLAEAKEKCHKACYYEHIVDAMDEEELNERMGYDHYRYASGRFAPKGHGTYRGYHPTWPTIYDMDAMNELDGINDMMPMMGYTRSGRGNRTDNPRMGYEDGHGAPMDRYSRDFNEYRNAKRHYTETHSPDEKRRMDEHANKHVMDSVESIREIWDDADHEQKMRIKSDLTKLVNDMNV